METSYSNTDNCKFESLQSEESNASDIASPNCLEVPNILTLTEEQCLVWYNTSRITKWNDMPEVWVETMAPLATSMRRIQSVGISKSRSNLANLELSRNKLHEIFVIFNLQIKWLINFSSRDHLYVAPPAYVHEWTLTLGKIGQTGKNFVPSPRFTETF